MSRGPGAGREHGDGPAAPAAAPPVRYHVADLAVARIAASRARSVPGVIALRPDLSQTLLGLAGSWLSTDPVPPELRAEGVVAAVHRDRVEVQVAIAVRLAGSCRKLAETVQHEVADAVQVATGLEATVRVTIVDIDLG